MAKTLTKANLTTRTARPLALSSERQASQHARSCSQATTNNGPHPHPVRKRPLTPGAEPVPVAEASYASTSLFSRGRDDSDGGGAPRKDGKDHRWAALQLRHNWGRQPTPALDPSRGPKSTHHQRPGVPGSRLALGSSRPPPRDNDGIGRNGSVSPIPHDPDLARVSTK